MPDPDELKPMVGLLGRTVGRDTIDPAEKQEEVKMRRKSRKNKVDDLESPSQKMRSFIHWSESKSKWQRWVHDWCKKCPRCVEGPPIKDPETAKAVGTGPEMNVCHKCDDHIHKVRNCKKCVLKLQNDEAMPDSCCWPP